MPEDTVDPTRSGLQRLWTPWRSEYVGAPQSPAAFLCELQAADPAQDRENLVLHREDSVYLLLNRFPYNTGHLLVAPRAHLAQLAALESGVRDAMFALLQRAAAVLDQEYHGEGMNVGMNLGRAAGAGVPDHLHTHLVPRWVGDTNFMTDIGSTRVLPETLGATFDRLRPYFD